MSAPRLGIFKLASCDGCQLQLLSCEDELLAMTIHDIAPTYAPAEWQRDWTALKEGGSRTKELYYSTKTEQLVQSAPEDTGAILAAIRGHKD